MHYGAIATAVFKEAKKILLEWHSICQRSVPRRVVPACVHIQLGSIRSHGLAVLAGQLLPTHRITEWHSAVSVLDLPEEVVVLEV